MSETPASTPIQQPADKAIRVVAYIIDVIPAAIFMFLLGFIPLVGPVIFAALFVPYWLLRDIMGASLGKLILGMKVVAKDGQPPSKSSLIIRNIPFAIYPVMEAIPLMGYILGPCTALLINLIELVMLFTGERLGDKFAGTMVVKK